MDHGAWECFLWFGGWVDPFACFVVVGQSGIKVVGAWSHSPRVAKSFRDHELRALAKRPLDLHSLNRVTIVVSTSPQGDNKGQEQHCSFQMLVGAWVFDRRGCWPSAQFCQFPLSKGRSGPAGRAAWSRLRRWSLLVD
jgi:hypothetical protein